MGPHNDKLDTFANVATSTLKLHSVTPDFENKVFGRHTPAASDHVIRKVICNPPATIILWEGGGKTVVKCSEDDTYDPRVGFLLCCVKHFLGADNDSAAFHRFLKEWEPDPVDIPDISVFSRLSEAVSSATDSVARAMAGISRAIKKGLSDDQA